MLGLSGVNWLGGWFSDKVDVFVCVVFFGLGLYFWLCC